MSQKTVSNTVPPLSAILSRHRALLAGGGRSDDVIRALREWELSVPIRGVQRVPEAILRWSRSLRSILQEAIPLGTPVGLILQNLQPYVRREERLWRRLQGVEVQFGFQGAVAMVLPWGVAALAEGVHFNFFSAIGFLFQAAALGLFYYLIKKTLWAKPSEKDWLFEFLVQLWARLLAGMHLRSGLNAALLSARDSPYKKKWEQWNAGLLAGALGQPGFKWPIDFGTSSDLGDLLVTLDVSGSPAAAPLQDFLNLLEEERLCQLEDRLNGLPTRISLVFSALLAPAVFLILLSSLWPTLSTLTI